MENKYRTPKIEEFVQGFEFELRKDYKFIVLNFESNKSEATQEYSEWVPCKVWWKMDENARITDTYDGYSVTITGLTNNFFKPFDEESFLKQGLIRVKI